MRGLWAPAPLPFARSLTLWDHASASDRSSVVEAYQYRPMHETAEALRLASIIGGKAGVPDFASASLDVFVGFGVIAYRVTVGDRDQVGCLVLWLLPYLSDGRRWFVAAE